MVRATTTILYHQRKKYLEILLMLFFEDEKGEVLRLKWSLIACIS